MSYVEDGKYDQFDDYQYFTGTTALFDEMIVRTLEGFDNGFLPVKALYLSNTINEEAGELAGHVKRWVRDDAGVLTGERREALVKELGDLTYYIAQFADLMSVDFGQVIEVNVAKLTSRKERGQIKGSGDNR
jgi:NTP pyrophosphatase (non-canonical NTP hydrolase)